METYTVAADIGTVAVKTESAKFHFANGYGDGQHKVFVCDAGEVDTSYSPTSTMHFVETFEVFEGKTVEILNYDCEGSEQYPVFAVGELDAGRWFVYNDEGNVYFVKEHKGSAI